MKTRSLAWLIFIGLCCGSHFSAAQPIPAFSGAEGPGATATGGRGGDVYHVTTLDPDKDGVVSGSLKFGVNNAPSGGRIIVFDVGGTIYLDGLSANDRLRFGNANITIAGQTAPGPGITIAGTGTKWTGENIILRNITIRPNRNTNGTTHDAFDLQVKNSILDHVSATWHTDEGISITDSGINSTVQYSLIGEGLNYEGHSFGSIIATEIDGTHYSFNHNYYAHNNSRLPRLGSEIGSTGAVLEWSNNVVYNWQSRAGYSGTNQQSRSNFIGNYYIKGQNNGTTAFRGGDDLVGYTQIYQSTDPALANKFDDDKDDELHDGIIFGPTTTLPNSSGQKAYAGDMTFVSTPFVVTGTGPHETADVALDRVLAYGGANWANRNPIDQRIFDSVSTGTGRIIADLSSGVQATEWATVLSQQASGGAAPFTRDANWDVDADGMPGWWELEHGLDPNVANNNADFDNDGYTDVEEYINEIAAWPAPQPIEFIGGTNGRYAQISNWDIPWQPSRYDTAVIANHATAVVDAVGQHAGEVHIGTISQSDSASLSITDGWLKVEDSGVGLSSGKVIIGDENLTAAATLSLSGGELFAEQIDKSSGSTFDFTGGTLHADQVNFDLVIAGGALAPGSSIGTTAVAGNTTLHSASTLQIELEGSASDQLIVQGNLDLGNDTALEINELATPSLSSYLIAQYSGLLSGAFHSVSGGYAIDTTTAGEIWLIVDTAGLPGDYNDDGVVNAADYTMWRDHIGQALILPNDTTPGSVDPEDFNVWRAHFGQSTAAATVHAPEPTSVVVLAVLVWGLLFLRRDGQH